MPLLGAAAMLLSFDIAAEAIAEHDQWHTHEHLPERLSIPGFLRGTRWIAMDGGPRYCVLYEAESLATLSSDAYLERLNNPTPWTSRMMPHYRGMKRGLCRVAGSFGLGMGHFGLLVRFKPAAGKESLLRDWLLYEFMPSIPTRPGLGSVHLLEGAVAAQMTVEQSLRGADSGMDWVVLATGYGSETLQTLGRQDLGSAALEQQGASGVVAALYRTDYMLAAQELARRGSSA